MFEGGRNRALRLSSGSFRGGAASLCVLGFHLCLSLGLTLWPDSSHRHFGEALAADTQLPRRPLSCWARPAVPPYLFADDCDPYFSSVGRATMLEQENALPRSQLHFAINNRHGLAGARQDHADV